MNNAKMMNNDVKMYAKAIEADVVKIINGLGGAVSSPEVARRVLEEAHAAWVRMGTLRARRERYLRYTYGDQWSDPVRKRNGKIVTEGEQFAAGGSAPLTNNLIRRMVKAVVGRYRMDKSAAGATGAAGVAKAVGATANAAGEGMQAGAPTGDVWDFNRLDELDARTLEEFLISGMAVHRVWRERRCGGSGVWVDNVSPARFFVNAVSDVRGSDIELIGRLVDMSMGELLMRFSGGDAARAGKLRALYSAMEGAGSVFATDSVSAGTDFFHAPAGKCRVIETWRLECREVLRCHDRLSATFFVIDAGRGRELSRLNGRRRRKGLPEVSSRWEVSAVWRCRMLAPDGSVLDEFDSPLRGGAHPFAVKLYPLVDGDVHSLVEDVIDQQRNVNRLITLLDRMMGTAAKGVLLFPTGCKVEGQKWSELAERWSDPGGVIPYRPYQGAEPHQVVTPISDFGANTLLKMQMGLFEDVSGVSDALMGKSVSGVVGIERYESEVRNASVAVNDLLRSFGEFTGMRDRLMGCFG